ncbi:MAG: hypothetical protein J7604_23975 [Sporocytophaga sp.]|uniref:hypothetical protein n=1 Tax=Sporocytophaga sp. TaxID=2231183 RepID=UPI001B0BD5A7|nr:hypothetical protein [Sporocytophaga sp.]MBO9703294.1 hypothetical protein [Sporocytophaga sp.]
MKKIKLNINHPDKVRAEAFLNALKEELEMVPFDWKSMKQSTRIIDAVKMTNTNKTLTITIIFTEFYEDADLIARANSIKNTTRWGYNGSIMYLVESSNSDIADNIISTFAGKE